MSSSPTPQISFSAKAKRTKEQPINALIEKALANPSLVNFAAGLVDSHTLPLEICRGISDSILADHVRGRAAMQYPSTAGVPELRRLALRHIESLEGKSAAEMSLTPADLVITNGSQQALYIIGDVLIDPGDIVIAANPSYFVFTGTLQSLGANVMTVPMDEDGMNVDAVDRLLAKIERDGKLSRVRMIYCTSYYQNPTGLTLSRERRPKLLEIAKKYSRSHRILILEDAAYRELGYDSQTAGLPSIKSFDPDNRYTILACTFSKPFAPGIKTGYSAVPKELMTAILNQKGNHDFGSSSLCQHIATEALRDGKYLEQVEVLKNGYRQKRDTTVAALEKYMPKVDGLHWTHPHGGLYVWLTLPESINTTTMFEQAAEAGVLYVPGNFCFQPDENGHIPTNHLRLCYGNVSPEQVEPGIQKLAGVVNDFLRGGGPKPEQRNIKHGTAARATA